MRNQLALTLLEQLTWLADNYCCNLLTSISVLMTRFIRLIDLNSFFCSYHLILSTADHLYDGVEDQDYNPTVSDTVHLDHRRDHPYPRTTTRVFKLPTINATGDSGNKTSTGYPHKHAIGSKNILDAVIQISHLQHRRSYSLGLFETAPNRSNLSA